METTALFLTFVSLGFAAAGARAQQTPPKQAPTSQAAAAQAVATTVRDVTVYPVEALVTRAGKATVERGVTRVEIRALPAALRDESLRLKCSGGVNVVGVDVLSAASAESPSAAVEELRGKRNKKQREREANLDKIEVLKNQRAYLDSLRAEAPKAGAQGAQAGNVDPAKWKQTVEFLTSAYTNNVEGMRQLTEIDAQIAAEITALDRQLELLQQGRLVATKTVAVDLLANETATVDLEVSYLLGGAGWQPVYDLRAAENLKNAQLLMNAMVTQRTGEDWTDVNLTLSTAKPERGAQAPKPQTTIVSVVLPPPAEAKAPGEASKKSVLRAEVDKFAAAEDRNDSLADLEKRGADLPALAVDAQVSSSGLSTQLRVPRPESVPADNRPHRVRVAEIALPLDPTHVAVPKNATRFFVQAKPKNTAAFAILAGAAQVFVGNDFVGRIAIGDTPIGEKLDLSLGADPGITIERRQEKADREGPGFLGSRARWTYKYRITIKNSSAATGDAQVEVIEPIPISRDDRIKVSLDTAEPAFLRGADEDRERETQGFVKWRFSVAKGEERVIQITYVVSAPQDLRITGLDQL